MMEIRELKYFLTVAREQSISKASKYLYITQPSLTRQMQNLERELGKTLFIRGNKKITLTEEGVLLRKRAEEIVSLCEKTTEEIGENYTDLKGKIAIGSGESYAIKTVAKVSKAINDEFPGVKFDYYSGDTNDVCEKLDKGLIDFGILVEPTDLTKYEYIKLPLKDTWGVIMRKDSPLSKKEYISPEDLISLPLICSKHSRMEGLLKDMFKDNYENINIVVNFNLLYNASILVKEGLGYAIGLDKIIDTSQESELCFVPLKPRVETALVLVYKRYQVFSKPCKLFLKYLLNELENQ